MFSLLDGRNVSRSVFHFWRVCAIFSELLLESTIILHILDNSINETPILLEGKLYKNFEIFLRL